MIQFARVVVVIGLVIWAAVLATPKGRTPLALRAIQKMFGRTAGIAQPEIQPVSTGRRLVAFGLVLVAFIIAVI